MICRVCLEDSYSILNIFDESGTLYDIANILEKYLWFKPCRDDPISTAVCCDCWQSVQEFHQFYIKVEQAHTNFTSANANVGISEVNVENKIFAGYEEPAAEQLEPSITIKEELMENIYPEGLSYTDDLNETEGEIKDELNPLEDFETSEIESSVHEDLEAELDNYTGVSVDWQTSGSDYEESSAGIKLEDNESENHGEEDEKEKQNQTRKKKRIRKSAGQYANNKGKTVPSTGFTNNNCLLSARTENNEKFKAEFCVKTCNRTLINDCPPRKRQKNVDEWIDNKAKAARAKGEEGVGRKGKTILARSMKEGCDADKCRLKCHRKIEKKYREDAFTKFWKLKTRQDKWNCIVNWVRAFPLESQSDNSSSDELHEVDRIHKKNKKTVGHKFQLPVEKNLVKVCKKMFLNTLGKPILRSKSSNRRTSPRVSDAPLKRSKRNNKKSAESEHEEDKNNKQTKAPKRRMCVEKIKTNELNTRLTSPTLTDVPTRRSKRSNKRRAESEHNEDNKQTKAPKRRMCIENITANELDLIKKHIPMQCELCCFITDSYIIFTDHFKTEHEDVKPYVTCCNRRLNRPFTFVQHALIHENPENNKCYICNKSFSEPSVLRSHILLFHAKEQLKYACDQCPKRFLNRYRLNLHMPFHIPLDEWKFVCKQCPQPKYFPSDYRLQIHINGCHEKPVNMCHVCGKEYRYGPAFNKHVRSHFSVAGPRLKCTIPGCDTWLKDDSSLKTHLKRHEVSDQTHTCKLCNKQFKNRDAIWGHMRYYHSNISFECTFCNKSFKKPRHLKEHVAAQHTGKFLYQCNFCDRSFRANSNLCTHRKKVHPVEYANWKKTKCSGVSTNIDSIEEL